MKTNYLRPLLCALLFCSLLGSCGSARYENIDYAQTSHWLSLPTTIDKGVDVFYLYPTAWQKVNSSDPSICDIDNASMLHGAGLAFNRQATAFEPTANIFAPFSERGRLVKGKILSSSPIFGGGLGSAITPSSFSSCPGCRPAHGC